MPYEMMRARHPEGFRPTLEPGCRNQVLDLHCATGEGERGCGVGCTGYLWKLYQLDCPTRPPATACTRAAEGFALSLFLHSLRGSEAGDARNGELEGTRRCCKRYFTLSPLTPGYQSPRTVPELSWHHGRGATIAIDFKLSAPGLACLGIGSRNIVGSGASAETTARFRNIVNPC
ncbi:hypothetical protein FA95DRAFT_725454 [Auriscalpium vulgare]|uniref:Uncharacterized protein n=1 Tax=Auriscalpium vulgare TaxID=40419 RepID=A0ACB8SA62_9AGAM|nr:hypothetical protein FA95DRAFT_725454 [Auriscalpium vulgare]